MAYHIFIQQDLRSALDDKSENKRPYVRASCTNKDVWKIIVSSSNGDIVHSRYGIYGYLDAVNIANQLKIEYSNL